MGKNTFGKTMPRALSQNLKIMGEQIMLARKRRHLSMQDIADRATVTRLTVSKVEHVRCSILVVMIMYSASSRIPSPIITKYLSKSLVH